MRNSNSNRSLSIYLCFRDVTGVRTVVTGQACESGFDGWPVSNRKFFLRGQGYESVYQPLRGVCE